MAQFSKAIWVEAVTQKCVECIYDPNSGNGSWREQIKQCTATDCPLYPVRPLPMGEKQPENPVIPNLVKDRQA